MEDLPAPAPQYRVDRLSRNAKGKRRFESHGKSLREDHVRQAALERNSWLLDHEAFVAQADDLAARLNYREFKQPAPETLASHRHMRDWRIKACGALWQLWDDKRFGEPAAVTIIPRSWECVPDDLYCVDPRRLLGSLRTDFNRHGAAAADGYFIGFIHGEYAANLSVIRLHVHGMAAGGMIRVIDALRDGDNYYSERNGPRDPSEVWQRIVVSREPLTNIPDPLTYMLKPYWHSVFSGDFGEDGKIKRARGQRLPEPVHTQVLLWLDRWSLADISLLMKVRVGRDGFQLTTP